ncbi:MAG: VWA domain-containing protein [Mycobacteriaceae bacterium]
MSWGDFAHPWWLLFGLTVIALTGGYIFVQLLRSRQVLRFSNFDLLDSVAPQKPNFSRHVPAALLLIALLLLTVALAGPTEEKKVPRNRALVMLVIDVSQSMRATDVTPSRLAAAQQAAKDFADGLTPGINLGLIAYAGTASVLVSPTTNRESVKTAVDKLQLAERTATGEAIYMALQSIATLGSVIGGGTDMPPARIVLASDGKETVPDDPDQPRGAFTAARAARDQGVPVSSISFGTKSGTVEINGRVNKVPVDDPSLAEIAKLSGGEFYSASSLEELNGVYDTLEEQIGFEIARGDSSRPWVIAASLLLVIAAASALIFTRRLP